MLALNLGLAFGLELVALVALGLWGTSLGSAAPTRTLFGIAAPLLTAVVWGIFLSPKAAVPLSPRVTLLVKLAVFGAAALALGSTGRPLTAGVFAVIAALNTFFLTPCFCNVSRTGSAG